MKVAKIFFESTHRDLSTQPNVNVLHWFRADIDKIREFISNPIPRKRRKLNKNQEEEKDKVYLPPTQVEEEEEEDYDLDGY